MKLEKLNDNKIKITFSIEELEKQNIDYHCFMSNSIENKYIFSTLLCKAKEELNFNTDNSTVSVETFELSDGNFILTISKVNTNRKKVILNRKINKLEKNSCIYEFANIDNFCDFCLFLKIHFPKIFEKLKNNNSLFKINNKYLATFENISLNYLEIGHFLSSITEFGNFLSNSTSLISKINENSNCIIKNNAMSSCLKLFP